MMVTSRRRVPAIVVAILCAVVLVTATACGSQDSSSSSSKTDQSQDSATQSSDEQQGQVVSTPVGDLTCPASWGDDVQIENNVSGDSGSLDFYGTANGERVLLFSLVFGDTDRGYQLGTAPDSSGTAVPVSLDISVIQKQDGWSDDDANRLSNLQDGVNDLLDQIYNLDGYQSN